MSLAALASSLSMKACLSLTTACLRFVIFVSLLLSWFCSSAIFLAAVLSSIASRTLSSLSWSWAARVTMSLFILSISSRLFPHLASALSRAASAVLSLSSSWWMLSSFSAMRRAASSTWATKPPLKSAPPLKPPMVPSPPRSSLITACLSLPMASSFSLNSLSVSLSTSARSFAVSRLPSSLASDSFLLYLSMTLFFSSMSLFRLVIVVWAASAIC
mmetsp:Transcript_14684/g.29230  ORF Transcript_14684/g.29230 Transcript_14684/m.29230 type:complete len:216 (+) Transcript_14684:2146-2793(+)